MDKGDAYTLRFAVGVCLVCSLLLATVSAGLRDRQDRLAELARQMNVLRAFGADLTDAEGRRLPMDRIEAIFTESVESVHIDAHTGAIHEETPPRAGSDEIEPGRRLPLYRRRAEGEPVRYAFPLKGPGVWGPIRGYLALEADGSTIAGITFYEHQETPGLGGEIERDWFQEQFRGKQVFDGDEIRSIRVWKGPVPDRYPEGHPHAVDGISGATSTGDAVTDLLEADLRRYEAFLHRLREH